MGKGSKLQAPFYNGFYLKARANYLAFCQVFILRTPFIYGIFVNQGKHLNIGVSGIYMENGLVLKTPSCYNGG